MRRTLRPAFVITLAALTPACTKSSRGESAGGTHVPTATAATATATGREPTPEPPTRVRAVRSPLPEAVQPSPGLGPNVTTLNPQLEGRFVYAAASGRCIVMLPPPPGTPPPPPGGDNSVAKNVDCPEAMLDPAWDTCLHGTLMTDGTRCACYRPGNPPPPPLTAECPKRADGAP